jgi:hypothetical protein
VVEVERARVAEGVVRVEELHRPVDPGGAWTASQREGLVCQARRPLLRPPPAP